MNFLGLSQDEIDQSGAQWTIQEITQQPEVWLKVQRSMARDAGATRAFLDPLLCRNEIQIVLTGAGTSASIGECLSPAFARQRGLRVQAIATTDLVAAPDTFFPPDIPLLLVSFARSGNSPESVAALELAGQFCPDCYHLIITCNPEGALYRRGKRSRNTHVVLLPDETNDRGFAMTSSFSTMMLAAALAFELVVPAATATLARWASQMLADFPALTHLGRAGFERVVFLGSRELKGLAREAALKMLELTDGRVVAVSDTPLGFRHGPKTIIDAKTLVVMFLCNHVYTRAYERDLLTELRRDGIAARVIALTAGNATPEGSADEVRIPEATAATDLDLCFPYAVFAQSLALQQSLALGFKSDAPNARGVVNRVVQGVSIYPWDPHG